MNNNQQFDEHIREQFSNYSPDVHPRIWENIIAEKERRKPAGLWFSLFNRKNGLLLLCLLLAGGSGAWLFLRNSNGHLNTATTPTSIEKSKPAVTDQGKSTGDALTGNNNPANSPTVSNNDNTVATVDKTGKQPGLSINKDNSSLSTPASSRININSSALQDGDEQSISILNKRKNNQHYNKKGKINLSIIKNPESENIDETEDGFPGQGTMLGRLTYNAEKIAASRKTKTQLALTFDPLIYLPGCPSIERDAAGNKKYLEIYAGPDFGFRSLSDTANSAYLQKRRESAKFTSAYSAGIRYTKVFNNSMSIRAGANYSQINEKFTYTQGNLVQVTYIIDANGDTTGSYTTTGTRYKTTHNKYRSIDIPVMLGYEVGNGRLHANINVGPVINIYSWQKGEVLDMSGQPVTITTGKGSSPYQFRTNAGIGFMGAVSVYYRLNDKIHLMAEPYFRYNLSPMNKDNITLKQKYQTAGLRLGLRIDLK